MKKKNFTLLGTLNIQHKIFAHNLTKTRMVENNMNTSQQKIDAFTVRERDDFIIMF